MLVQILLPLEDNAGTPIRRELFERTRAELIEQFGGITAHSGAPAEGVWQEGGGPVLLDRIVVLEVVVEQVDRGWWTGYRQALEQRFGQKALMIRLLECSTV
jgi:hypothetical protein